MKHIDRKVPTTLCAISTTSSAVNKTGSWRFSRPVFIDSIPPCSYECPAGEDVAGFMYLAANGRFEEAWRLIIKDNPFPAITGRVCFHGCEAKCNRAEHDEAVSINSVERYIGDYGLNQGLTVNNNSAKRGEKVAIVGAGPAGLTASYYLRLWGYHVTIFDASALPGGLMRYGIPSYRLPKEILDGEISRLRQMGLNFKMGTTVGKDISWNKIDSQFDAVFVAIGAHREATLKVKGIEKKGIFNALRFLREVNLGRQPALGKRVAVIGGGNSAIDCARVSRRFDANVTIIYRRREAEMPANAEEIKMAREEGVQFLFQAVPLEVRGNETVAGLRLQKVALKNANSSDRGQPAPTGETFYIDCDTLILAIGEDINKEDLPPHITYKQNRVETGHMGRIGDSKFFAGGDIIDTPRTVTHAIASGKRGAVGIDRFLAGLPLGKSSLDPYRLGNSENISFSLTTSTVPFLRRNRTREVVNYSNLNPFYFDRRPRMKTGIIPAAERARSFQDVVISPIEEEVTTEARRCFNCGSCTGCGNCYLFCPDLCVKNAPDGNGYTVDMDYCKGCGICVQECPRGAIKMEFVRE
ncbi:MAG: FAD-dependent oxidoreductase [Deltaproteobacteria bacterium]|nr:FAD-dependent oxidoreductase [Deltaproteobacteria bacterium]